MKYMLSILLSFSCLSLSARERTFVISKVSPKGALSAFLKAHYYYDVTTGDLVAQHAVEGLPGTPETVWTLEK